MNINTVKPDSLEDLPFYINILQSYNVSSYLWSRDFCSYTT